MKSLDMIFAKEFKMTCQQRLARTGAININQIPVPDGMMTPVVPKFRKMNKVLIRGIRIEYFAELNNTTAYLWLKPNLRRRKFDRFGKFKKENGHFLFDDVVLPQDCAAIISEKSIRVPLAFKQEGFDYVDFLVIDGKTYYIYVVPKENCYKLNELALVISVNRLRSFYSSMELKLQSGSTIYLSVVPFQPTRAEALSYRVLSLSMKRDFSKEWSVLYAYWVEKGVLYPRELTELADYSGGVANVAYRELDATLEEYQRYNPDKSLANSGNDDFDNDVYTDINLRVSSN